MNFINDKGTLKSAIGTYYNYIDVNNDKNLRLMMIDYYRNKTKKWLNKSEYQDITNCFVVTGNSVKLTKKCTNKLSNKDKEKVVDHIYQKIHQKRLIKKVLFKYTKLSDTNWYDLKLEKKRIKKLIKYVIKKKILSSD